MKTMIKILNAIALTGLFAFLTACVPCYYAPNAQNVPLFTEKGEVNGSAAFKIGMRTIGCDLQVAASVTDHIGFMVNYNHFSGKDDHGGWLLEDYSTKFKGNMGEFGLGYYLPFKNKFVFETYAGYGGSKIENDYELYAGNGSSTINSGGFFIQPAIGYYKKNAKIAFSTRFRSVDFNKISYDTWLGEGPKADLIDLQNNPSAWFFEPAFTLRAGGEHVKFQFQTGFSIFLGNSEFIVYDPFNLNFGLVFSVHGKKKSEIAR